VADRRYLFARNPSRAIPYQFRSPANRQTGGYATGRSSSTLTALQPRSVVAFAHHTIKEYFMESFTGQIQLFAFNYAPKGWMPCDGRILQIREYSNVFALLGSTYGGDGQTNFALPNLVGKEPIAGSAYCICVYGIYPPRW
jgi:hypothetical protein